MNPYLAKLRLRDETHHPCGPSKPSKPILSVVDYANTTGETGFEGFEGDLSKCLPENEAAADEVDQTPLAALIAPIPLWRRTLPNTCPPTAGSRPYRMVAASLPNGASRPRR